jgi:hypothetical protein
VTITDFYQQMRVKHEHQLLQAMNEAKYRGFEQVQFKRYSQVLIETIRTKYRDNLALMILFLLCYDM